MRTLVLSDIHANLQALDAVLLAAGDVDRVWCLGDLMGYGPDPNGVICRLRQQPALTCLAGNHDIAALALLSLEHFNSDARKTIEWQRSNLTDETLDFLKTLTTSIKFSPSILMAHGSPLNPDWGYILSADAAQTVLATVKERLIFVGHSHVQGVFSQGEKFCATEFTPSMPNKVFELTGRHILNPGSVGQPRDRDPRASFAIYDDVENTWQSMRADYDHASVSDQILQIGLPMRNAARLANGS